MLPFLNDHSAEGSLDFSPRATWRFCVSRLAYATITRQIEGYSDTVQQLETCYGMFSVNLDEALGLRRGGASAWPINFSMSLRRSARIWYLPSSGCFAPCKRIPVVGTSRNLAPLNPAHFQNSRNQRTARCNGLFSRVLLTSRSRFLYKILALAEMVEELAQNYASAVVTLGEGLTPRPDRSWDILETTHYDLNTCFRESVVILKCFLHVLPEDQLAEFQACLKAPMVAPPDRVVPRVRHVAHRRLTLIKGQ